MHDAPKAAEHANGFSQDVVENFHSGPMMCNADSRKTKDIDVVPEKSDKCLREPRQWGIPGPKQLSFSGTALLNAERTFQSLILYR